MKKRQSYTVPLILFLIGIAIYTGYMLADRESKYNWNKTYKDGKREPYDFGVFKSMLGGLSDGRLNVVKENIEPVLKKAGDSSTYVFIGRDCYMSRRETDELMKFAARGGDVLLISEGLPDTLLTALSMNSKPVSFGRFEEPSVLIASNTLKTRLRNYRFTYRSFDNKTDQNTDWYYLNESDQLDYYFGDVSDAYVPLNTINGQLNHIRFKTGKGSIQIHTSPILFTNYALKSDTGFIYLNEVFQGIARRNIIYDVASREFKDDSDSGSRQSDSPLTYILKQKSLRIAWYLFLSAVLLFFLFRARRKQRIIPVLDKKRNTSLSFIETLSGLFFNNANHRKMAEIKMQLFIYFIRHKLGISRQNSDAETIRLVSLKTEVPEREIQKIFDYYRQVIEGGTQQINAVNLMELDARITAFYKFYKAKK